MVFVMPDLSSAIFWTALWKIIVANVILSGDNAVVIAMACHKLSDKYRNPAMIFGSAGAIVLRIVFCAVIVLLLAVPYLKLVGGALLDGFPGSGVAIPREAAVGITFMLGECEAMDRGGRRRSSRGEG